MSGMILKTAAERGKLSARRPDETIRIVYDEGHEGSAILGCDLVQTRLGPIRE
jgi:hypothetical protein